jgi:D-alanyl-D-alanine carboxypeptidase
MGGIAFASVFAISAVAAFLFVLSVQLFQRNDTPSGQFAEPQGLTAEAWGIFNPETGSVLAGKNIEQKYPIASITKLFTAEAVLRSERQENTFSVAYSDLNTEGRAGKLAYGERVTPHALLFPLLIESSNDAAEAIKRYLGDEYVRALSDVNQNAGLHNTEIKDASGLSSGNVSTVTDLSSFFAHVRRVHPLILDITQLRIYVGPHTGYINNNPARSLSNFTGGKQGYTSEANRTFVGTFKLENGQEIGIVLFKSSDLLKDINELLTLGKSTTGNMLVSSNK